ncbi:MAG: hydrogenase iron-sulfur subunit [Candidatus Odinarchaeota archaeon]
MPRARPDLPAPSPSWEPVVTAFTCQWCTYAAADLAGTSRFQYPPNVRIIRIPCTGKMDIMYALHAMTLSDGVFVSGCLPNQCHYIDGNFKAEKRMKFLKDVLEEIGVGGKRLEMHFISASMATTFVEAVSNFRETLKKLGPNPAKRTRSSTN